MRNKPTGWPSFRAAGLGVNAALVPCPFCGGEDGYRVHEGSTFRWLNLLCAACGEMVAEARNTANSHEIPTDSTPRYSAGDEAWNAAGAYAQGLRENRDRAVRLLHLAMAQLRRWGDAYDTHQPPWLPPAGYVRLAKDVEACRLTSAMNGGSSSARLAGLGMVNEAKDREHDDLQSNATVARLLAP